MANKHPRVLYAKATYGEEERKAVKSVLDTPESLVGGEYTETFEERVSSIFGKSHGVMVNSGSSANLLAFELADLEPGTEVITPIVTFSTTVGPIVQKDLTPVFTDVGLGDYQVDVAQVEQAISPETGALMIPNLLGNVPDMARLRALADEHDLVYIEDSADTIGAKVDDEPTGTYSDISTTSFYGSHVITAFGSGGMVSVDEEEARDRLRVLRGWGRSSAVDESANIEERYANRIGEIQYDSKFIFEEIGYNFLGLEASAAFGLEQLDKLEEFARRRRANYGRLQEFFATFDDYFILPEQRDEVTTSWLGFPITVRDGAPFSRVALAKHLEHQNIQTRPLFSGNLLRHPAFESIPRREIVNEYPIADHIMRGSLVIGCHQSLSNGQLNHVEQSVVEFLHEHA